MAWYNPASWGKKAAPAAAEATVSVASKIKGDATAFSNTAKNLGGNVQEAFSKLGDIKAGRLADFAKSVGDKSVTIAAQPVRWAIKGATIPLKVVNKAYKSFPKTSAIATIAGAAWAGSEFVKHRAAKRTERAAAEQLEQAQLLAQAGVGNYAPASQQVSYQNQVTPEEYAAMEARMKGTGMPSAGHADAITAARQQGTAVAPSL